MDQDRKKDLKKQYAQARKDSFAGSLPFDRTLFEQLFDFLDAALSREGCDDTLKHTGAFLREHGLPVEQSMTWLRENGGYCDCEVLANIEDKISGQ
jgi:hypothetical protein